jgi:hypothetical protein
MMDIVGKKGWSCRPGAAGMFIGDERDRFLSLVINGDTRS